jgi:hypothetical protein
MDLALYSLRAPSFSFRHTILRGSFFVGFFHPESYRVDYLELFQEIRPYHEFGNNRAGP